MNALSAQGGLLRLTGHRYQRLV
ncbi:hypothetical protein EMIT0P260_50177 [Pseudomonas sp. IT-P260]